MISIFKHILAPFTRDELVEHIREGMASVMALELQRDDVVDVDALHASLEVGQVIQFGRDDIEDAMSMYEGLAMGMYYHKIGLVANGRVSSHRHLRGNKERWRVLRGSVTVLWGDELQHVQRYYAGQSFELDGHELHAFLAHDEGVEADLHIEKKTY